MNEVYFDGKLPVKTKVSYAMGDLAANIVCQSVALYYLYFLTDITFLKASLAGISLLIVRCIDAFSDPLIGYVSDRTKTRWGRRRPYLLFGSLGCGLFFFLLFTYLPIKNQGMLFVHATISYLVFYVCFSLVNIPYSALTPDMTQDYDERTNLTAFRMTGAIIGMFIAAGLTPELIKFFPSERTGYSLIAAVYGLLFIILTLIVFLGVRENKEYEVHHNDTPMFRLYLNSFRNRPFLMILIAYIMIELAIVLISSTLIYYMEYYMKRKELLSTLFATMFGMALVCIPFWALVSKHLGKKWSYFMGIGLFSIAMVCIFFIKPSDLLLLYLLAGLAGMGLSTEFVNPWAMMPDTIEYNELKTGERNEGVFYGIQSFGPKLSGAIAGLLVGETLTIVHYVPKLVNQSYETLLGIRLTFCIAPVFFTAIGMIAIALYPISHRKYQEIVAELEKRRGLES
jgi:GPH family glycoside/pentoside/hexuronide:cation symporter